VGLRRKSSTRLLFFSLYILVRLDFAFGVFLD